MKDFAKILIDWYKQNKRSLSWRETTDPYLIWVSEIILQQTRVEQGSAYYERFIKRFPTLLSLAVAHEEEVLKEWQGLGYYSRARNLHAAAKQILQKHEGQFPSSYAEIHELKGIGDYTAAAIASIAFNLPHAAVDGNVYRVLSRIYNICTHTNSAKGKREFSELANTLLDKSTPGDFNQAIMEFGALHCTPKNPSCPTCPFNQHCIAYQTNTIQNLPTKKAKQLLKERYFNYFLLLSDESCWIEKRTGNDIWKNMYQLPLIETPTDLHPEAVLILPEFKTWTNKAELSLLSWTPMHKHLLSHQRLHTRFFILQLKKGELSCPGEKVFQKDIFNFAVPKVVEQFLIHHFGF